MGWRRLSEQAPGSRATSHRRHSMSARPSPVPETSAGPGVAAPSSGSTLVLSGGSPTTFLLHRAVCQWVFPRQCRLRVRDITQGPTTWWVLVTVVPAGMRSGPSWISGFPGTGTCCGCAVHVPLKSLYSFEKGSTKLCEGLILRTSRG